MTLFRTILLVAIALMMVSGVAMADPPMAAV